jgi:hypothetical protein
MIPKNSFRTTALSVGWNDFIWGDDEVDLKVMVGLEQILVYNL